MYVDGFVVPVPKKNECMADDLRPGKWTSFPPRMLPFDGKRMIWGGFKSVVDPK